VHEPFFKEIRELQLFYYDGICVQSGVKYFVFLSDYDCRELSEKQYRMQLMPRRSTTAKSKSICFVYVS